MFVADSQLYQYSGPRENETDSMRSGETEQYCNTFGLLDIVVIVSMEAFQMTRPARIHLES